MRSGLRDLCDRYDRRVKAWRRIAAPLVIGLGVACPTAALGAQPVYVADNAGKVERLNPKTGKVKVVSDDPLLGGPGGITVGRGGKLLVSDFDGGSHSILRVNPGTETSRR